MGETTLHILGQEIRCRCETGGEERLRDLARALEARLSGFSGDSGGVRQLTLTALALMDEAQAAAAALARARAEIDRLNDLAMEAQPPPALENLAQRA